MDDLSSIKTVKTLALIQIPKHGGTILTSRGTQGAIGRNTDSVEVSSVSNKVIAELAVGQCPNLDKTIPSTGYNKWDRLGGTETDARYPLGVTFGISANGVLAFTEGVPKLDGLVTRSRNDLTVVHAEGNGENILGVSYETTSGASRVDLPETKGAVPRSGEGELSIGGDDNIGDEVGVSPQGTLGVTVGIVFAGVGVGKTPDEDGLITGGGEDEVGVLGGGGDGCDPVAVAAEGSSKAESFGHGWIVVWRDGCY